MAWYQHSEGLATQQPQTMFTPRTLIRKDSNQTEATGNEHKEWHNPLAPTSVIDLSSSEEISPEVDPIEQCNFFRKTATCRFGEKCSRVHITPTFSRIILIRNMFKHINFIKARGFNEDSDSDVESKDSDIYKSFLEFYEDVLPEFKSVGKVINFKVCCNYEPHLRGNVYIEYEDNPRNEFWEANQFRDYNKDTTSRLHHQNVRHGRRSRRGSRSRSRSRKRSRGKSGSSFSRSHSSRKSEERENSRSRQKKAQKSKSRSQSEERDSERHAGKKHKHSKHKKSKKSGKKKKKSSKKSADYLAEQ